MCDCLSTNTAYDRVTKTLSKISQDGTLVFQNAVLSKWHIKSHTRSLLRYLLIQQWIRLGQEVYREKKMGLSFTLHAHITVPYFSGSPGSPSHPWASWLTCSRKASPEKQTNYIETTCDEGGKKNPQKHCQLNIPHLRAHPNSGSSNEGCWLKS